MKEKPFDCVKMKQRIQQEIAEEEARLGSGEVKRRAEAWKEVSSSPLARWWRTVARIPQAAAASAIVREDPPEA